MGVTSKARDWAKSNWPTIALVAAPMLGFAVFVSIGGLIRSAGVVNSPAFLSWQLLFALQTTSWALLWLIGTRSAQLFSAEVATWWPDAPGTLEVAWRYIAPRALVLVLALAPFASSPSGSPALATFRWAVFVLAGVALVAAWPFLLILGRTLFTASAEQVLTTIPRDLPRVRSLRARLQSSIAALGLIVAMHVVAYGAFRQAVVECVTEQEAAISCGELAAVQPLPEAQVLLYGAVLTAALGAIYWEVRVQLDRRARSLIDSAAPLVDGLIPDGFAARRSLRKELSEELEVGSDLRSQLVGAFGVLSPLIGALVTGLTGLAE